MTLTLVSLFDGIGGFPLAFERAVGQKSSRLWRSTWPPPLCLTGISRAPASSLTLRRWMPMSSDQLDLFPTGESSPLDGPAKTSAWQAVARAWLAHAAVSGGPSPASWLNFVPVGSLAKTFLASCHRSANAQAISPVNLTDTALPVRSSAPVTGNHTTSNRVDAALVDAWKPTVAQWVPSSGRWQNSGMGSPTEFWTLSTSECPSSVVASSLSDILERHGPHLRRYYLSQKAATGILRRAGRRGRRLPPPTPGGVAAVSPAVTAKWAKRSGGPAGDETQNLVMQDGHDTHTHTTGPVSTLQGGGRRGHRIDAESAAGGHLIVEKWSAP